jgi:predicted transcriptional regulator
MKTAISLPDKLFVRAEALAADLGISRSQLYARTLEDYLSRRTADQITARLDQVYRTADGRVDQELAELAGRRASREENW